MSEAGFSRSQQFWAAILTSAPQPVGAAIAFLLVETIQGLLGYSFAFAAGAMLALVATDLIPRSFRPRTGWGPLGLLTVARIMLALSVALSVQRGDNFGPRDRGGNA